MGTKLTYASVGYDALAALNTAVGLVLREGLEVCFNRHALVAAFCREAMQRLGFELFPPATPCRPPR